MSSNFTLRCGIEGVRNLNMQMADGTRITFTIDHYFSGIFFSKPFMTGSTLYDIYFLNVRLIRDGITIEAWEMLPGDRIELRMHNGTRREVLDSLYDIFVRKNVNLPKK
jgi:hypothetical protein